MMQIRQITLNDIDAIFEIRDSVKENYLSPQEVARLGITKNSIKEMLDTHCGGYLALIDNMPAGFVVASYEDGKIMGLFIRPEFEGNGIGKKLMIEIESWLKSKGIMQAWLTTSDNKSFRAHGFYKALGWRESGIMPDGQIKYVKLLECDSWKI